MMYFPLYESLCAAVTLVRRAYLEHLVILRVLGREPTVAKEQSLGLASMSSGIINGKKRARNVQESDMPYA